MPLGSEVGLGPGDIVIDEDPAPPLERGTAAPTLFGPCLLWPNGRPSQHLLSSCQNSFAVSLNSKSEKVVNEDFAAPSAWRYTTL